MTIEDANRNTSKLLADLYESREAATITDWLLEKLTGWQKIDRIIKKNHPLSPEQEQHLNSWTSALAKGRPIQYVLEEADFMGLRFFVDENVLIPRPETEELVEWMLSEVDERLTTNSAGGSTRSPDEKIPYRYPEGISVLDIGTGSGCIPVSFKLRSPACNVSACDISEGALIVAKRNAVQLNASVIFFRQDILDTNGWPALPVYDIIVSNPPYIPQRDKTAMRVNVLDYEPHLALFTSDEDPYIFYRNIAAFATNHLSKNGLLFFEIHESGADAVISIMHQQGFQSIEMKMDLFEKPRMIRGVWPG